MSEHRPGRNEGAGIKVSRMAGLENIDATVAPLGYEMDDGVRR